MFLFFILLYHYIYDEIVFKKGPPLPVSCGYPSLVTSHDGQRVYVVGCKEDGRGGKDIYELNTLNGSELEWMTLSDKITNQRFDTVSMLIPNELTNCEE